MSSIPSADLIGVAGLVVGVVAVIVGVAAIGFALYEGHRQIKTMEEVRDDLRTSVKHVEEQVSTHYVGKFPKFMDEIVGVLRTADQSITVFCDLPTYGLVSDPECFRRYTELIETRVKKDDFCVRMLNLDPAGRTKSVGVQCGDPGKWAETRRKPEVAAFIEEAGKDKDSISRQEFLGLIEGRQVSAIEHFESIGVDVVETAQIMPLYFWIADDKRAVFALTQFNSEAHEAGFQTSSKNLISAMTGIYERYRLSEQA